MDFIWYVVFSTIEAMSYCVLMLCFFRFGYKPYLKEIILSCVLFSIVSYASRVELDLASYFPIFTMIFYSYFGFSVLKVPPIWAIIVSGTTIIIFFIIQTTLMLSLISLGFITLESVENYHLDAYILQVATALILFGISVYFYRKGYGFTFSFDRFRWKGDNALMLVVMFITYGSFAFLFLQKDLFYGIIVETLLFSFLMYLTIRKERTEL